MLTTGAKIPFPTKHFPFYSTDRVASQPTKPKALIAFSARLLRQFNPIFAGFQMQLLRKSQGGGMLKIFS